MPGKGADRAPRLRPPSREARCLPDGFPRYRMRLRRIKNGLARYTVIFIFLVYGMMKGT